MLIRLNSTDDSRGIRRARSLEGPVEIIQSDNMEETGGGNQQKNPGGLWRNLKRWTISLSSSKRKKMLMLLLFPFPFLPSLPPPLFLLPSFWQNLKYLRLALNSQPKNDLGLIFLPLSPGTGITGLYHHGVYVVLGTKCRALGILSVLLTELQTPGSTLSISSLPQVWQYSQGSFIWDPSVSARTIGIYQHAKLPSTHFATYPHI